MQYEYRRIVDASQVVLRQTERAVTPFGGLVVLVELMRRMDLMATIKRLMPFEYRSNNIIPPEHTLLAFWLGVVAGARRFSHFEMLRRDEALRQMCGVKVFPCDDTVRNFFMRFGQGEVTRFFDPLWHWFLSRLPAKSCILDLDSTLFQRYGSQQGAAKGYNPTRHGGRTHHPLIALLSEPVLVLHSWLRRGDTQNQPDAANFVREALALLPAGWSLSSVRADSGFFSNKFFSFLEECGLSYTVVVRRNITIQRQAFYLQDWTPLDPIHDAAQFLFKMPSWSKTRRFIVIRTRVPSRGCTLFPIPGYEFSIFVTNRTESPAQIWHHYEDRASIEPRLSELKEDLAADDFCLRQFFSTEAAVRSVFFVFNLLSLLQTIQASSAQAPKLRPSTLRSSLFTCGAIAGRSGRKTILFLSQSWGGLQSRISLLTKIATFSFSTSPKLDSPTCFPVPFFSG